MTVEGEAVGLAEGYEGVEVVERGEDDDGDDDGGAWETPAMLPEELEVRGGGLWEQGHSAGSALGAALLPCSMHAAAGCQPAPCLPQQLSARRSAGDDGDDLLYGDDDDEGAALGEDEAIARALAEAYARLSSTPLLGAPEAGPLHAAELMLCAVRELQAQPSPEDLAAVAAWAAATGDTAAAVALVAVLDRLPQPSAENQRMQEQLAELCAQKEVDLEAELQRTYGRRQQDAGGDAGDAELDSLVAL